MTHVATLTVIVVCKTILAGFFQALELTIRKMQLEKTPKDVQLRTRSESVLITKRRDFGSYVNNTIDSYISIK